MTLLSRIASMLDWLLRRRRAETRLDEELQTFVDMSVADKVRNGVPPAEARRLALAELGGVEPVKEHVRTKRHGAWIDDVRRDARHALRMFARNPGFTAVVLITLALGVGANTAIFSLIDALMLRTLPVLRPHELVQVNLRAPGTSGSGDESFSHMAVRTLDQQRSVFSGVAGFSSGTATIGTGSDIQRVSSVLVTGGYYRTLGIQAAIGRLLASQDDEPGAPLAVVISDGFWQRRYARSPSGVGSTLIVNGQAFTVVGVSPRGFTGVDAAAITDVTMPVSALRVLFPRAEKLLDPGTSWLRVLARPERGISAAAAEARINALWPALADSVASPRWSETRRKTLAASTFVFQPGATGWTSLRQNYARPLFVLMAVAGVVLLVMCANVASLFLARASTRQREIAVRLAIGAGRGRIVRQLIIEGVFVSSLGAALGIGVAWVSSRFLVDLIAARTGPITVDLTPNLHILGFAAALAVISGVVFGLVPAAQMRREGGQQSLAVVLKTGARTVAGGTTTLRALVAVQVALSLVLVTGAQLFVGTLRNLQRVNPGFTAEGVLFVEFDRGTASAQDMLDAVRRTPGVAVATVATQTPLNGSAWTEAIVPAEKPLPEEDTARMVAAAPQFFEALRIGLVRGRAFNSADAHGAPVAVVSERYAAREFPGQDPIGRQLSASLMGKRTALEIVGVVEDVQLEALRSEAPATVYVPYDQFESIVTRLINSTLIVRTDGGSATAATRDAVRAALQPLMKGSPVSVQSLPAQVSNTLTQERIMATLASGFGALALVLCLVGLYGMLAYSVTQRSREIGIRMALGSRVSGVVSLVVSSALRLAAAGLILGWPMAWFASRSIESMLFGVRPGDLASMCGAAASLVLVALIASFVPARRAASVDPLTALRQD